VVAPVIAEPVLDEMTLVERGVNRQQLDGGDAELDEVIDDRRRAQGGEGAAAAQIDAGVLLGEAADMELVDDGLFPSGLRLAVVTPGEGGVDDPAFRHDPSSVAAVEREIAPRAADAIAEMRIAPAQGSVEGLGVRIEQQLVGVEAVAAMRVVGAVDAIA